MPSTRKRKEAPDGQDKQHKKTKANSSQSVTEGEKAPRYSKKEPANDNESDLEDNSNIKSKAIKTEGKKANTRKSKSVQRQAEKETKNIKSKEIKAKGKGANTRTSKSVQRQAENGNDSDLEEARDLKRKSVVTKEKGTDKKTSEGAQKQAESKGAGSDVKMPIKMIKVSGETNDGFSMSAHRADGELIGWYNGYVPEILFPDEDSIDMDIDIETGRILSWTKPNEEELLALLEKKKDANKTSQDVQKQPIKTIKVSGKTSDGFSMRAQRANGELIGWYSGYVPEIVFPGDEDYIEIDIDIETGQILNWTKPNEEELLAILGM